MTVNAQIRAILGEHAKLSTDIDLRRPTATTCTPRG